MAYLKNVNENNTVTISLFSFKKYESMINPKAKILSDNSTVTVYNDTQFYTHTHTGLFTSQTVTWMLEGTCNSPLIHLK